MLEGQGEMERRGLDEDKLSTTSGNSLEEQVDEELMDSL